MQLWRENFHQLGFRRKSKRYWQCRDFHGLPNDAHLSVFLDWPGDRNEPIEFFEFHVSFEVGLHNIHFYFHEIDFSKWELGGHTSRAEIELLCVDADQLLNTSFEIAKTFLNQLHADLIE